jgi:hypothetical protein
MSITRIQLKRGGVENFDFAKNVRGDSNFISSQVRSSYRASLKKDLVSTRKHQHREKKGVGRKR